MLQFSEGRYRSPFQGDQSTVSSDAIRHRIEADERRRLAPYASLSDESRGRRYPSSEHEYRTPYQRDRDKIIYTPSFRRLQYKTQVFVNFEGDHYRTRLTHTIEGSQIARTIARALAVNEDLVEAIALAHDLGHPPYGHASEDALDSLMKEPVVLKQLEGTSDPGGFEHNVQSLRIVDVLEGHNPRHPGLNLTWEVREGVCKHRDLPGHPEIDEFRTTPQTSLEAQIANLADEIAYDCHDVDDGLRAGLVTIEELEESRLWREALAQVKLDPGDTDSQEQRYRAVKTLVDRLVTDVVTATMENIQRAGVRSASDVRECNHPLIAFSPEIAPHAASLKAFLYRRVYYHYQVVRMKEKARRLISDLFTAYLELPEQLPTHVRRRLESVPKPRAICDYIAGMTDRYAVDEHRKLFEIDVRLLP